VQAVCQKGLPCASVRPDSARRSWRLTGGFKFDRCAFGKLFESGAPKFISMEEVFLAPGRNEAEIAIGHEPRDASKGHGFTLTGAPADSVPRQLGTIVSGRLGACYIADKLLSADDST